MTFYHYDQPRPCSLAAGLPFVSFPEWPEGAITKCHRWTELFKSREAGRENGELKKEK
jgi:hypothetical protein